MWYNPSITQTIRRRMRDCHPALYPSWSTSSANVFDNVLYKCPTAWFNQFLLFLVLCIMCSFLSSCRAACSNVCFLVLIVCHFVHIVEPVFLWLDPTTVISIHMVVSRVNFFPLCTVLFINLLCKIAVVLINITRSLILNCEANYCFRWYKFNVSVRYKSDECLSSCC